MKKNIKKEKLTLRLVDVVPGFDYQREGALITNDK
jgi:hypothetical protein